MRQAGLQRASAHRQWIVLGKEGVGPQMEMRGQGIIDDVGA